MFIIFFIKKEIKKYLKSLLEHVCLSFVALMLFCFGGRKGVWVCMSNS